MQDPATERANNILTEFDQRKDSFAAFTSRLKALLEQLLPQTKVHTIEARTKARESLGKKLLRPEKSYSHLNEITDICGIRVVTYFADDVPEVYRIIKREFGVVESSDKADLLNPDQFGYLSFHCIVNLPNRRARLTENKDFIGLKAEIQIRSILQHAWAEIEHDLGYKTMHSIPRGIRRPFSRLAGLLELGDIEFERIREELRSYEREIKRGIGTSSAPLAVDKNSLSAFIKSSVVVHRIDTRVSKEAQLRIVFSDTFVEAYVARLAYVGINTIGDTERLLLKKESFVTKFATAWFCGPGAGRVQLIPEGIGISFLGWTLVLEKGGVNSLTAFLSKHAFNKNQNLQKLADALARAYKIARRPLRKT